MELTEKQAEEAIRICDQMQDSVQRLIADFAKMKEAADDFAKETAALRGEKAA